MSALWLVCCVALGAIVVRSAWKRGPRYALGCAMAWSVLVPVWVEWRIGALPIDVRIVTCIIGLSAYCLHPSVRLRSRLVGADWALIALGVVHLVSDAKNSGFRFSDVLRIYGEWAVPYLTGRLAVQSFPDARALVPVMSGVCVALAVWAATESIAGVNPANAVFGARPRDLTPMIDTRLGLKRAEGPTRNAIYLGMLFVMLLPWTVYGATLALSGAARVWLLAAPIVALVGLFCTVSRSAFLACIVSLYLTALLRWRRARWSLLAAAALVVAGVMWQREAVIDALHRWAGDDQGKLVTIDGKKVAYSGTVHRLMLPSLYRNAMAKAGWLGFGTDLTSTFPLKIGVGDKSSAPSSILKFVDNAFILLQLRFGYLGVACFCLFLASTAWYMGRAATRFAGPDGLFCGLLCGVIVGVAVALLTVWLPQDFGFWLICTAGIATGLEVFFRDAEAATAQGALVRA
ncbi:MAG TPA: hypothetical protein VHZ24_13975 [Pirellulales bacterium]|jgi:hypothetical protein|nr:hypothetical protein [Pirellulales bacterium]